MVFGPNAVGTTLPLANNQHDVSTILVGPIGIAECLGASAPRECGWQRSQARTEGRI